MKREHNEHEPVVDDAAAARVLDRVLALPPTEDERRWYARPPKRRSS